MLAGVEPATSWSSVRRRIQLSHRGPTHNDTCIYISYLWKQWSKLCVAKVTEQFFHIKDNWTIQEMNIENDIIRKVLIAVQHAKQICEDQLYALDAG